MTKAEFLKQAQEKYKNTINKNWVAEMNFIYSPNLILRVWFDHTANNHKGAFMHRWCTVENIGDETIFNKFDEFLCEEREDFPLILIALKKALKKNPTGMIDHVEYKRDSNGLKARHCITPIENFEYTFTVKDFCEQIGIEN